jgi:hypothetical protein
MTTPLQLTEQIMRLYYGGDIPDDAELDPREVRLIINQLVNRRLRLTRFEHVNEGDRSIPACMVAEFNDIDVEKDERTGQTFAKLPVAPIALPRNMGVWEVYESENYYNDFIPVAPADLNKLKRTMAGEFQLNIAYQPQSDRIIFSKDLLEKDILKVSMKLLVSDVDKVGDLEPMPIPANMEADIIDDALKLLRSRNLRPDNHNDSQDTAGK